MPAPISAESHDSSPTNEQGSACGLCKREVMQIRRAVGRTKALRSAGWPTIFSYVRDEFWAVLREPTGVKHRRCYRQDKIDLAGARRVL